MLFFGKKKEKVTDLSWLNTDMHSHLVPAIDDGSPDSETSIELIEGLQKFGFQKIITTPHVLWDVYPNTSHDIQSGLSQVKNELENQNNNIELSAAAEYFIDEHFQEHLNLKEPLLTLSGNLVLVEFSMVVAPMDLQQVLFEMQIQNYQPVIAHPERYIYLKQKKSFFDELKNAGAFLQLNLLSLTGYYGKAVQELAEYLVKKDMYDYAGTDLHNERHLEGLQRLSNSPMLDRLKDSGRIKNHLL
ncbi:MAG TPA: CpsB/CapC family capsule biosynthesis tyrosine phosphatase [Flavisolibacter sp.]|nr:CpsB/CapC family capsule biosynthesis tyrosine phosphatase [Flavisolibacter sp.]